MAQEEKKSANELAVDRTNFALERTELAVERTVMAANRTLQAWIRTALSLISFGFTIYKILLSAASEKLAIVREGQPRRIGLFLIALGTASMVVGIIEYFQTLRRLDKLSARKYRAKGFPFYVGLALAILGLFLFVTIVIQREVF